MKQFETVVKLYFKKILNTEYIWFRAEFQHRGSVHLHGVVWLEEPHMGLINMGKVLKKI